jgi:hypothetical protein
MTDAYTSKFYTEILERLDGVRRKQHRIALVYGILATLLISFTILLIAVALEGLFSFGTFGRTILFATVTLMIGSAAIWFIVRPVLSMMGMFAQQSAHALAVLVGSHFPLIRDRLLDALQIYEGREALREHYSIPLIDASFTDLYQNIQPLRFADAVNDARVQRMRKVVLYASAFFVLLFVVPQFGFYGSFYRILNFNTSFASPLPLQLVVEPGNIDAVRGQTVPVIIRTQGKPVQRLSLFMRQQGQVDFEALILNPKSAGVFQSDIQNIKATTEYFASVEDIKSDKFTINVLDRPLIRTFQLKVESPAYTRIPAQTLEENIGDVTAYPGSTIRVHLQASKALSSSVMVFNDKTTVPFVVSREEANAAVKLQKDLSYHFLLNDLAGLSNIDPVEYSIKSLRDQSPTVELIAPGKNIDLTGEMSLDLGMRIKDDFGFSKLRLAYKIAQSRYEQPQEQFSFLEIPIPAKNQESAEIWHHWDLAGMHLVPEDVVAYYVEVFDNDNINGPKSGRSEMYMIRLPSLEEVFTDVNQSQQQSLESMQDAAKEAQQLKKDVETLHRELQKNRSKADWQQQKKAEQLLKRYEEMKKKLDQTVQNMDENVKKMDENKLLSSQTMEKYQELQKLLEQLKSPELQQALKKLQESMKQLSPEEMQRAMEQLKASEDQFRKSLERTIELLKRIAIEQKLDEVIKRAEEMKKQQGDLKQQASKSSSSDQQKRDELAKKQDDLQKQMGSLEKATSEVKKSMEEFPQEMPLQEMSKAEQSMKQKQTGKKMNSAAQQMRSGDMQDAEKNQEESEKDLSEMEEELSNVQKQLQDNQQKQIVNEMRKQLQNVIELSKNEESLKNTSKEIDPNSPSFRESAEHQNDVMNDLGKVANAMAELSKKTFAVNPEMSREIGNAQKGMQDAMQNMETRNPVGTSQKQGEAMGSLNRAASMMQSAINAMGKGGKGGSGMAGLMGRLGQMAGEQSGINDGTQQAMGKGGNPGQGMSAEQQASYQRLANQQSSLQKSLQDLSEEAKNTGEFSKLLGDLDHVARQMQEIVGDLNQGEVNPQTLEKQDRILSRLLDASRSARERDYEKRRKAEAGKNYPQLSPAEIDLTTQEGRNRLREEMLKVREGKYSQDYEDLIRKYFEELEKEHVDQ